jgi:hypothetical protein
LGRENVRECGRRMQWWKGALMKWKWGACGIFVAAEFSSDDIGCPMNCLNILWKLNMSLESFRSPSKASEVLWKLQNVP